MPDHTSSVSRQGFKLVHKKILGPNIVDHMVAKDKRHLTNSFYHGEKKNYNFERYVTAQKVEAPNPL